MTVDSRRTPPMETTTRPPTRGSETIPGRRHRRFVKSPLAAHRQQQQHPSKFQEVLSEESREDEEDEDQQRAIDDKSSSDDNPWLVKMGLPSSPMRNHNHKSRASSETTRTTQPASITQRHRSMEPPGSKPPTPNGNAMATPRLQHSSSAPTQHHHHHMATTSSPNNEKLYSLVWHEQPEARYRRARSSGTIASPAERNRSLGITRTTRLHHLHGVPKVNTSSIATATMPQDTPKSASNDERISDSREEMGLSLSHDSTRLSRGTIELGPSNDSKHRPPRVRQLYNQALDEIELKLPSQSTDSEQHMSLSLSRSSKDPSLPKEIPQIERLVQHPPPSLIITHPPPQLAQQPQPLQQQQLEPPTQAHSLRSRSTSSKHRPRDAPLLGGKVSDGGDGVEVEVEDDRMLGRSSSSLWKEKFELTWAPTPHGAGYLIASPTPSLDTQDDDVGDSRLDISDEDEQTDMETTSRKLWRKPKGRCLLVIVAIVALITAAVLWAIFIGMHNEKGTTAIVNEKSKAWEGDGAAEYEESSIQVPTPTQPLFTSATPWPTFFPSQHPTDTPTQAPSETPTQAPSETPTQLPSEQPTIIPFVLEDLPEESAVAILAHQESPQNKAWEWMNRDSYFAYYSRERLEQRFALATLYYATDGFSWNQSQGWLSYDIHECNWFSMAEFYNLDICYDNSSTYKALVLPTNGLKGMLPSELILLSNLHHINVGGNQLGGALPDELGREMPELRSLLLFNNSLNGTLPISIGRLSLLEQVDVQRNRFELAVPSEVGLLHKLKMLDASQNFFSVALPEELGQLEQLETLHFEWNLLTGSISSTLGNLQSLLSLKLSNNYLQGFVPSDLGRLSLLETLEVFSNQLDQGLPSEFGLLVNLKMLNLVGNSLGATIPSEIARLSNLRSLDLSQNFISGTIPDLGEMQALVDLFLDGNKLSGEIPKSLPTKLERLNLSSNVLSGTIPAEVGDLVRLTHLDCDYNGLNQALPTDLGRLMKLQSLSCNFNSINGAIPSEIGQLSQLTRLALMSNSLSGSFPHELGELWRLELLLLNNNMVTGPIPSSIGKLWSLQVMHLSTNALTGSLPSEIGLISSLTSLFIELNALESSIPSEIGRLARLEDLVGWENHLSGHLPSEIGSLSRIRIFDLSLNKNISGTVPLEIGGMTNATEIWLSATNISGNIPSELGRLSSLEKLYLAASNLSGTIPVQLATLSSLRLLTVDNTLISGHASPSFCELEHFTMTCSEILCGCDCLCLPSTANGTEWASTNATDSLAR